MRYKHFLFLTLMIFFFLHSANSWAKHKDTSKKEQPTQTECMPDSSAGNHNGGNAIDNFGHYDKNHDNILELKEWPSDRELFDTLDLNHNKKLTRCEYVRSGV